MIPIEILDVDPVDEPIYEIKGSYVDVMIGVRQWWKSYFNEILNFSTMPYVHNLRYDYDVGYTYRSHSGYFIDYKCSKEGTDRIAVYLPGSSPFLDMWRRGGWYNAIGEDDETN